MFRRIVLGTALMFTLFFTLIAGLFLSGVVHAQPDVVKRALDDINQRTGRSLTLNDLNWRYSQEVFDGNNLGCPHVANTSGAPVSIIGYQVEFDEGFDDVWEWDYRVSGDGTIFLLCAPEGYNPVPTPTNCAATTPRLTVGGYGRVLPGLPNVLRDAPAQGGELIGEVPGGATFTVIGGSQCSGGYTWWQIDYNGQQGWTVESINGEYALEPVSSFDLTPTVAPTLAPTVPTSTPIPQATAVFTPQPTALQFTCIDLLPRLSIGDEGRVTPGLPNILRERPTASGRYIADVPGEARFRVLDGPVCAEGYIWWQINYNNHIGWTIENFENEYVLEPFNPTPAVITPYNASRLKQVTQIDVQAWALFGHTYHYLWIVESSGAAALYQIASAQPFTWERIPFPIENVFASVLSDNPNDPLWFVRQSSSEIAVYTQAVELITILDIARFGENFTPLDVYKQDGQSFLLATNPAGQLSLWELSLTTPTPVQPILAPFGVLGDAVFTGGDFGLFAAINDSRVNFYDASGGQISTIDSTITPSALAFGINGVTGTLAVGGLSTERTSVVQLWDVGSQTLKHTLQIPSGDTQPIPVMHPHQTLVAAIGHTPSGYGVHLWDMATGATVYEQSIPANGQLTFSQDGKMLYAALESGQILGWATEY